MTFGQDPQFLRAYRAGRFTAALGRIRQSHAALSAAEQAVLAELLQLTGDNSAARDLCLSVLKRSKHDKAAEYRSEEVLAAVAIDEGRVRSAAERLSRALHQAQEAADLTVVCRLQLRMVPTLSELEGPAAVATLSSEVRRNVLRSGDPHLLALLHLRFAQLEAKSGLLETAWRHLESGWRLIEDSPNCWIDGLLSLDGSSVASLSSEPDKARELAARALKCAEDSGHVRTAAAALSNLCVLALQDGDVAEAEHFAHQAMPLAARFETIRASLLDTIAQVALLKGDHENARRYLDDLDSWLASRPDLGQSWLVLAIFMTRIRLMKSRALWSEAGHTCDRAIRLADSRKDSYLGMLFRATKADLLTSSCNGDDIGAVLSSLEAMASDPPLAVLAEVEKVRGRLATKAGMVERSLDHIARAGRIVHNSGGEWSRRDVRQSAREVVRVLKLEEGQRKAIEDLASRADLSGRPVHAKALLPPSSPDRALPIEAAAKLQAFSARPDLLALECVALVDALACASRWVISRISGSKETVIAAAEDPLNRAETGTTPVTIALSGGARRTYEIHAVPRDTFNARTTLLAIKRLVENAVALETLRRQEKERASLWPVELDFDGQSGLFASPAMREVVALAHRIAQSGAPVLITGETGVGKEVVAREIHARSPHASGRFVPYNCTAVPRDMMDSQLFGHRRGAFTGAIEHAPGLIRGAQGGTVFLDEIGELSLESQPKLLRFLESSEIQPIGEPQPVHVNVRIIAATNADLGQLVRDGRFREDLYYRLDILRLSIPPLRERREEIPAFCAHFLERYCRESRKPHMEVSDEALEYLVLYEWPGNVRQLAAEMRRVVALAAAGARVSPADLSPEIRASRRTVDASHRPAGPDDMVVSLDQPLPLAVEALERAAIERALRQCRGRVERAAEALGISRKGLFLKRKRLGLPVGDR